jgi:glycosyltransferase involved in cell wall biosynthesis
MNKFSAVIITYNEGRNIERCLESLRNVADEIVVVDSFSTDNTEAICARHNVHFVQREWDSYSEQKNYGNNIAQHDYILSLDADEELSPALTENILAAKQHWQHDVYYFNRLNFLGGRAVKHCGWYPNKQYRLFDRRKTKWNSLLVHEILEITPTLSVGFLAGDLLHYTCESREEYAERQQKYATLRAQELSAQGKSYLLPGIWFRAAFRFLRSYILQLGFLEGTTGWFISYCNARTVYQKYKWAKR